MKIRKDGFLVFFVKVAVAAVVLYLALTLSVKNIGEDVVVEKVDYIGVSSGEYGILSSGGILFDTGVDLVGDAVDEVMNPGHYSTNLLSQSEYKSKFQRVCVENILMCVKIRFDGGFTYKDKYLYLASIIHVFDFLDEYSNTRLDASKELKEIVIKSDGGSRRGYATKNYIEVNVDLVRSYQEFFDLITHEAGHIWDLGVVRGNSRQKERVFTEFDKVVFEVDDPSIDFYKLSWNSEHVRKGNMGKEAFVSRYAASDPFEDLAEAFVMYINHNAAFRYLAQKNPILKQKYNYFANLFDGKYLFSSMADISLYKNNPDYRVWDITRMRVR